MKQILLLTLMTFAGGVGSLYNPFWGILLYYTLAVLRPQYLWKWALPVDLRWSLMAAGIIMASLLINGPNLLHRIRFNFMCVLMTAYALCLLLSCILAHDPAMAQEWGLEYGKILLIAVITGAVVEDLGQIRILAMMITVVLGYIAWEINMLYFVNGRLDIFHYGYGGLDNNGAGLMLAMGVPLAAAFAIGKNVWWQRGMAAMIGALLMHAVMMSYSRGAMIAASLGILWILMHYRPRRYAIAALIVVSIMISFMAGKEIRERLVSTMNYQQDASAQSRFESWSAAWEMIWDSPIIGNGIRNSNQFSQNYGADCYGRTIHNLYLQIGADTGIPAMCIYVTMIITALVQLHRSRKICEKFIKNEPRLKIGSPLIHQIPEVIRGIEGSVITFAFGGMFLSLEVFELSWLLLTIAGLLPFAAQNHVDRIIADLEEPLQDETTSPPLHWRLPEPRLSPIQKGLISP